MIAVDTNIPIRLIIGDDDDQVAAIAKLMEEHVLFVPLTVLLETEWVLRSRYGYSRVAIHQALLGLCQLSNLVVEKAEAVCWAIGRYAAGADLGDMIHLVCAAEVGTLATFDRRVGRHSAGAVATVLTLKA